MAPAGTDTVKLDPSGLRTVETRDPSAVSRLAMVGRSAGSSGIARPGREGCGYPTAGRWRR